MNADRSALSVKIRPAAEAELAILAAHLLPNSRASDHARRYADQQQGMGCYLIGWHGTEPVGHIFVRWDGPAIDQTGRYPPRTPYLEAAVTKPEHRSRGVGTHLIAEAERITRARRCTQVGLTVSSKENPRARRLYERLGYHAWDGGEYAARWEYETDDGEKATGSGVYIYLFKAL